MNTAELIAAILQNGELAAYVVGFVQLIKPLVKYYVKVEVWHMPLLVVIAAIAGAVGNMVLYGFTFMIGAAGFIVGALASGGFGAAKDVLAVSKKK